MHKTKTTTTTTTDDERRISLLHIIVQLAKIKRLFAETIGRTRREKKTPFPNLPSSKLRGEEKGNCSAWEREKCLQIVLTGPSPPSPPPPRPFLDPPRPPPPPPPSPSSPCSWFFLLKLPPLPAPPRRSDEEASEEDIVQCQVPSRYDCQGKTSLEASPPPSSSSAASEASAEVTGTNDHNSRAIHCSPKKPHFSPWNHSSRVLFFFSPGLKEPSPGY